MPSGFSKLCASENGYDYTDKSEFSGGKMNIILYSNKIDEYLKHDSVIDYDNKAIMELADTLFKKADNELDLLVLDDETAPVLIYHGLNGVYIKDYKKWIRLDARGNKTGVDAQFSIETEQLAFPVRPEMGEVDCFVVYPNPDIEVLEKLKKSKTRTELWENLPTKLEYNKQC